MAQGSTNAKNIDNNDLVATLALIGAMVLWSSSFIAIKEALIAYPPMAMTFLRMLVASFCFLLLWPKMRSGINYHKGDWKLLVGMAFCEPCLYFVCEGYALSNTSSSQAGMIVAVLPLFVAVSAWFILKERLSRMNWLGFFIALAGVIWLTAVAVKNEHAPNPVLGNILEIGAMCFATVYTLCSRTLSARYSPLFITAVQAWIGLIFFSPFMLIPELGLPTHLGWEELREPTLAVVFLGAVITLGAYGCYNFGISRLGAGKAATYTNIIPIFTMIMSMVWLKESMSPVQLGASALVLLGVILSQKGDGKRTVIKAEEK